MHGTAVQDSWVAIVALVLLCAVLASWMGLASQTALGAATGIGLDAVAGALVMSRTARWSWPAGRVTPTRTVLIGGCAAGCLPILTGVLPLPFGRAAVAVALALLIGSFGHQVLWIERATSGGTA